MGKENELAIVLGKKLLEQHKTLAFAESCTGGLASSLVTDIAGSSEYLPGSTGNHRRTAYGRHAGNRTSFRRRKNVSAPGRKNCPYNEAGSRIPLPYAQQRF